MINNAKTITAEIQKNIDADIALELLKKGNERFVNNKTLKRDLHRQITETAGGQYPFAVVLSCIDSRVPVEYVFDQGIGDIFSARVAGNIVDEDMLGSIEFACKFVGVKLIVVLGHTSCGAVKGACDDVKAGNLTKLLEKIKPAIESTETAPGEDRSSSNTDFVNRVTDRNTEIVAANILSESEIVNELVESGKVKIVRAIYDVGNGKVTFK